METASPSPRLAPAAVIGAGAVSVAAVLAAVAAGSVLSWALAGAVVVALAVALVQPSPLARLVGVLALQAFQMGGEEGLSAGEVAAGLALVAYLAHWYTAAWLSGRRVVTSLFDVAAVAWGTVGLVAGVVLGLFFGADPSDFRADVLAALPFLLYLPVKDVCAREPRGAVAVGAVLVGLALFASVQSVLLLRETIETATQAWEIADARPITNETAILSGLLVCFAALLTAREARWRLVLLGLVGVLTGGLLLSKSRGFWVAAVLGVVVLGVVARPAERRRLAAAALLGATAVTVVALALFADQVALLLSGSLNRLTSLATAGQDVSLLNRFVETQGAWERIRVNPVLGYGWGVQVTYYSLLTDGTVRWAFLHNGYVALWFKTGLWGLALMMTVWVGAFVRAAFAGRGSALSTPNRACAYGAMASVAALSLTALTSNPFATLDLMLIVVLNVALAHGLADRAAAARRVRQPPAGDGR